MSLEGWYGCRDLLPKKTKDQLLNPLLLKVPPLGANRIAPPQSCILWRRMFTRRNCVFLVGWLLAVGCWLLAVAHGAAREQTLAHQPMRAD